MRTAVNLDYVECIHDASVKWYRNDAHSIFRTGRAVALAISRSLQDGCSADPESVSRSNAFPRPTDYICDSYRLQTSGCRNDRGRILRGEVLHLAQAVRHEI